MVFNLKFTHQALQDISLAVDYYEHLRSGLGNEFITLLDSKIKLIINSPEFFRTATNKYRKTTIGRFPYTVYFALRGDTIVIASVIHQSRGSEFIKDKLN